MNIVIVSKIFNFFWQLCEKAGLYTRALQHYTELPDIKRVIINTHAIDPQALTQYFGTLSSDWAIECLREMLATNMQQNLQIVVNVSIDWLTICVVHI